MWNYDRIRLHPPRPPTPPRGADRARHFFYSRCYGWRVVDISLFNPNGDAMSMYDDVMIRLNEISRNPRDPALDLCFIPRAVNQRQDFCRNLGALLNALLAYNAEPPRGFNNFDRATHWMPLPEPPK